MRSANQRGQMIQQTQAPDFPCGKGDEGLALPNAPSIFCARRRSAIIGRPEPSRGVVMGVRMNPGRWWSRPHPDRSVRDRSASMSAFHAGLAGHSSRPTKVCAGRKPSWKVQPDAHARLNHARHHRRDAIGHANQIDLYDRLEIGRIQDSAFVWEPMPAQAISISTAQACRPTQQ